MSTAASGRFYDDDVRFAHVVADAADATTMAAYKLRHQSRRPSDDAGDAAADAEGAVRSILQRARPRDAVLTGPGLTAAEVSDGSATRRWIVHPLDGAENHARGVPVWATLLALVEETEVVAAVVSAPALQRRWWAGRSGGSWTGRSLSSASPCAVSSVESLHDASFSYGSIEAWDGSLRDDMFRSFLRLTRACGRTRAYGEFWSYMLVADGAVDIAADPETCVRDLAAVSLIVEEAGGTFTDFAGRPGPLGGSALAGNPKMHDAALTLLQ